MDNFRVRPSTVILNWEFADNKYRKQINLFHSLDMCLATMTTNTVRLRSFLMGKVSFKNRQYLLLSQVMLAINLFLHLP